MSPDTLELVSFRSLEACSKLGAIDELIETASGEVSFDASLVRSLILDREELMSTGMGLGMAFPHARVSGLPRPAVVIGVQPSGLTGYESIDGEPVRITCLILVPENSQKLYLTILADLVRALRPESVRQEILRCRDRKCFSEVLSRNEEGMV